MRCPLFSAGEERAHERDIHMQTSGKKLYAFNASSFSLDAATAEFLESRGAVSLDLGSYAYINSDAMPAILAELVARAAADGRDRQQQDALVAQLRSELAKQAEERQRLIGDNSRLALQTKSLSPEVLALKDQLSAANKTIESLRSENSRLQQAATTTKAVAAAAKASLPHPAAPQAAQSAPAADPALRQSYDRLLKEFHQLRSQSIEAIASLKVLEEENAVLQDEVEALRAHAKNAAAQSQPKAA